MEVLSDRLPNKIKTDLKDELGEKWSVVTWRRGSMIHAAITNGKVGRGMSESVKQFKNDPVAYRKFIHNFIQFARSYEG